MVGTEEYLQVDLATFCDDMTAAVREWCLDVATNAGVVGRLQNVVSYRSVNFMGLDLDCIA